MLTTSMIQVSRAKEDIYGKIPKKEKFINNTLIAFRIQK